MRLIPDYLEHRFQLSVDSFRRVCCRVQELTDYVQEQRGRERTDSISFRFFRGQVGFFEGPSETLPKRDRRQALSWKARIGSADPRTKVYRKEQSVPPTSQTVERFCSFFDPNLHTVLLIRKNPLSFYLQNRHTSFVVVVVSGFLLIFGCRLNPA